MLKIVFQRGLQLLDGVQRGMLKLCWNPSYAAPDAAMTTTATDYGVMVASQPAPEPADQHGRRVFP